MQILSFLRLDLTNNLIMSFFVVDINLFPPFLILLSNCKLKIYLIMQTLIFKIKCYKEWLCFNKNGSQLKKKASVPKHLKLFIEDNLIKISSNIFSAQSVVEEQKSSLQIKQFCSFLVSQQRKFECFWADTKHMLWEHFEGLAESKQIKKNLTLQNQDSFISEISKKINQLMEFGIQLSNKLISQMKHISQKPDKKALKMLGSVLQTNIPYPQRSVIFPDLDIKKQDSFTQNYVIVQQNPNQIEDTPSSNQQNIIQNQQRQRKTQSNLSANQINNRFKKIVQETIKKTQFEEFNFQKKRKQEFPYIQCNLQNNQGQIAKQIQEKNPMQISQTNLYMPEQKNTEQKIKEKIKQNMQRIKTNQQKAEKIAEKLTAQYVRVGFKDSRKPSFLSSKPAQNKLPYQFSDLKAPFGQKKMPKFENILKTNTEKQNPQISLKCSKRAQSTDLTNQHQCNAYSLNSIQEKIYDETSQQNYKIQKKKLFIQKLANIDEYAKATLSMYKPEDRNLQYTNKTKETGSNDRPSYQVLDSFIFQPVNSQLFGGEMDQTNESQCVSNKSSSILDMKQSWSFPSDNSPINK